jgi:aminoglycoside phosphotransferase (APT) family kinase protein
VTVDAPIELVQWVRSLLGTQISIALLPGGGSRTSYVVLSADGSRHLLRVDSGSGPLSGTQFTIEREFTVISALQRMGYLVPRILNFSAAHRAMLMEFVEGSTSYQVRVDPGLQRRIQEDLMRHVVKLHSFAVPDLGLSGFEQASTVREAVAHDLARLRSMYSPDAIRKEPEIDFALAWLERNIPDPSSPARLIHGDVGPGNFIFENDGRVRAIIDWEVAHLGHPLEDLAAILCRALGVEFGIAHEHIANYEIAAATRVDRDALAFGVILVLTRWYIGLNLAVSRPAMSQNVPVLLTYRQSVADALIRALAQRHGMQDLPPLELTEPTPDAFVHEYILHTLAHLVVPRLEDPYSRDRAQGLSKLSEYLRDLARYGADRLEREDIEDIARVTQQRHATAAEARAAACNLARSPECSEAQQFITLLQRINRRRHLIWSAAMGEMGMRRLTL